MVRRDLVGRYAAVRYDCASQSVAHWITRPANKVGLTDSAFTAVVQTTAEQIAALFPAPRTTNRPSTRRRRRPNPNGRLAMRSRLHKCKRRYRRKRSNSHRPGHRRHRSPRRPRPRRSASSATARSSAWTSRSPPPMAPLTLSRTGRAADETWLLLGCVLHRGGTSTRPPGRTTSHAKLWPTHRFSGQRQQRREGSCPGVGRGPRDGDRRLTPALAIDLAAARSGSRDAAATTLADHGNTARRPRRAAPHPLRRRENSALSTEPVWRAARPGGCFPERNDELGGQRRRAAPPAFEVEVLADDGADS